jgi:hypothetical protein
LLAIAAVAQQPPNVDAQRDAMKKLQFLVGKWSGEADVTRGPGDLLKLTQTENVQYKLDGLVMLVEGEGRNADGNRVYSALATIAFDDAAGVYHFRAYNSGRYLDTELTVTADGFSWGFTPGPVKINNTMKLSDKGEWVEATDVTMGSQPPRHTMQMTLKKQ